MIAVIEKEYSLRYSRWRGQSAKACVAAAANGPAVLGQQQPNLARGDDGGIHPVRVEQVALDQLGDLLRPFRTTKAPRRGRIRYRVRRRPTRVPKASGTDPLQPAEVDLAAMVDAIEGDGQFRVGAEQGIAAEELARPGQVGQLQPVAGQRVAEIAQGEEAAVHDAVEQLLDDLVAGHALDIGARLQAGLVERAEKQRTKPIPHLLFMTAEAAWNSSRRRPRSASGSRADASR